MIFRGNLIWIVVAISLFSEISAFKTGSLARKLPTLLVEGSEKKIIFQNFAQAQKNNFFSFFTTPTTKASPKQPEFPTIVIPPNYNVALGCFGLAGLCALGQKYEAAIPLGLLGAFLYAQTGKIRFLFDNEALEVVVAKGDKSSGKEDFVKTRDNFAVGGRNRWKYTSITDWRFIPSKEFPILVYFNEQQTSPKGQFHLFPVIMDGKVLYATMSERIGKK